VSVEVAWRFLLQVSWLGSQDRATGAGALDGERVLAGRQRSAHGPPWLAVFRGALPGAPQAILKLARMFPTVAVGTRLVQRSRPLHCFS
jgi:hypothetical protein